MRTLKRLLDQNKAWAAKVQREDPGFFENLSHQQSPEYLWIGCSDSRVPANQITGLLPGEVFVHRNVANLVVHTDLNCLSVLQFAVDVLKVKNIIVCGHYGCGGVSAVLEGSQLGLSDNWLRHVKDVEEKFENRLPPKGLKAERADRLCELNVIEQVRNVCETTVVQAAWRRGGDLTVHGWIYRLTNGLLNDLHLSIGRPDELETLYRAAISSAAPFSHA